MKNFELNQKFKLILLTFAISGAFFYSFKERSKTFFSKHPVYKSIRDNHERILSKNEQKSKVLKNVFPRSASILNDLEKINSKQSFFDQYEMDVIRGVLSDVDAITTEKQSRSPSSDPFERFRGIWQGSDQSLLVSKDTIKFNEEKKMSLQYLEYRTPGGGRVYGINAKNNDEKFIVSEVRTPEYKKIFSRIGVWISQTKILWLTQLPKINGLEQYRLSIDEVIDNILNVKSADINFKLESKKIDKVNFSSHQFQKLTTK